MKFLFCLTFLFFGYSTLSQSISHERIAKLKAVTVRITIDSTSYSGTGFFASNSGKIITCAHVVIPAIVPDNNGGILRIRKIFAHTANGAKIQVKINPYFLKGIGAEVALANDICIIDPVDTIFNNIKFIKLGSISSCKEGDEIYTCGFPLGYPYPFISKGIVSTLYIDTIRFGERLFNVQKVLADITLNKGNSGGAIIKPGKSIEDDRIIGVADFIINPIANQYNELAEQLLKSSGGLAIGTMDENGRINSVDPNAMFFKFAQILNATSIGISGFVAIDPLANLLQKKTK